MKKALLLLSALMLTAALTACGSDKTAIKDDNPAQAKVEETTAPAAETAKAEEPAAEPVVEKAKEEAPAPDDIWTYYDNATWSDDFNGVKSSIEKVVVTDQAPKDYDESNLTASAVGIKFKIENTTDKLWTTYPDQAELITSTGEQLQADLFVSDDLGGEIEEGVIKEGNVIWFLERGHASDVKWVKVKWYVTEGDGFSMDAKREEYSVKLELK
ncbi:hypothetical protein BK129_01410 [Paenibacillus amylolyticus]|uniref:hypothetical protein n=1 Tax=Paenibacillus amylolyticus TaxID=1451 RepID=UPI00097014F2|nr:hypothetical protein [Paenibacillus amylolyticus]OMF09541.1 hypothetical protein BK129_01410 [Paenibacillus amylolyticus]